MPKILCGKCRKRIEEADFDHHWQTVHRQTNSERAPSDRTGNSCANQATPSPALPEWRFCPICRKEIKTKNYKKHQKRVHGKGQKKKGSKTKKRKNPFAREYDGPIDFLDTPNVVSGGGFGVGKKKRK